MSVNATLKYVHKDHLGGTSVVTSDNGTLIESLKYYAFGECLESQGTLATDKLFTGQRLDGTGLYYYNSRYYDPAIGRFISPDTFVPWSTGVDVVSNPLIVNVIPAGLGSLNAPQGNYPSFTAQAPVTPQNLNRYSYVVNNPLVYNDPNGWWTLSFGFNISMHVGVSFNCGMSFVFDDDGNWAITSDREPGISTDASIGLNAVVNRTAEDNIYDLLNKDTYEDSISGGEVVQGSFGIISSNGEAIGETYEVGLGLGWPPFAVGGGYDQSDIILSDRTFENFTEEESIYNIINIIDSEAAYYYDYFYDYEFGFGYNYDYYFYDDWYYGY